MNSSVDPLDHSVANGEKVRNFSSRREIFRDLLFLGERAGFYPCGIYSVIESDRMTGWFFAGTECLRLYWKIFAIIFIKRQELSQPVRSKYIEKEMQQYCDYLIRL